MFTGNRMLVIPEAGRPSTTAEVVEFDITAVFEFPAPKQELVVAEPKI